MTENTTFGKSTSVVWGDYLPFSAAARTLGVCRKTLARLIVVHDITTRQIPGCRRKWLLRADVERILASAVSKTVATS